MPGTQYRKNRSFGTIGRAGPTQVPSRPGLYWENILVLLVVHGAAAGALLYSIQGRAAGPTYGLALLWLVLCVLSTTGGYHRLFTHRAYRAAKGVRLFYLLFGSASGQGPVLKWASDHRAHHAHTDEDQDPYNIKKGFWWAHIGWLLYRNPPPDFRNVKDLVEDPLVRFQERWYIPLAVLIGFVLPMCLAAAWGDAAGGLLLAGFLRLAIQYQATFAINSVTHFVGRRPYLKETSARDSAVAALLTLGEGYHNYHHCFPGDYRNGVRYWQFDPTKWWIWALSKIGLAWDLRRVPDPVIREAMKGTPDPVQRGD